MSDDPKKLHALELNTREITLLAMAWRCFKQTPEIDYAKLAELGGYTNVRSAANAINAVKKKMFKALPEETVATASSTPKKRGKVTPTNSVASEDSPFSTPEAPKRKSSTEEEDSPLKRIRRLKIKSPRYVTDDDHDDEEEPLLPKLEFPIPRMTVKSRRRHYTFDTDEKDGIMSALAKDLNDTPGCDVELTHKVKEKDE